MQELELKYREQVFKIQQQVWRPKSVKWQLDPEVKQCLPNRSWSSEQEQNTKHKQTSADHDNTLLLP